MPLTEKVRETRLRRALWRRGYRLAKSRTRDPTALTYRGYHITDHTGRIVAGQGNLNRGYAFSLDDVEEWLSP
jgi:hypothetical protein